MIPSSGENSLILRHTSNQVQVSEFIDKLVESIVCVHNPSSGLCSMKESLSGGVTT